MAPTDGAIVTKMNMCTPQTTDVNISKGQSSKASGLGGVVSQRSKSPTILYKYRWVLLINNSVMLLKFAPKFGLFMANFLDLLLYC